MKIGLENTSVSHAGTPSQHLARLLSEFAPEHEFIVGDNRLREVDIYHGFRPYMPLSVWWRRIPTVVTVRNLHFLRYPQLYSLAERMFVLRIYRRTYRTADRLITLSRSAREELSARLGIAPERIEVVMPLAAAAPLETPKKRVLDAVRGKYELPEDFILMLGTVEPRHHHDAVFEAMLSVGLHAGVVIGGRRTAWSKFLLGYARERHIATKVDFLYEISREDLPALFRLARVFVYLPDAKLEASIVPVVEALRAGLPAILSDTPLHREVAGDAAVYVHPEAVDELSAALENALCDADFRRTMMRKARKRSELFSEYAVTQRLIDIYSSL